MLEEAVASIDSFCPQSIPHEAINVSFSFIKVLPLFHNGSLSRFVKGRFLASIHSIFWGDFQNFKHFKAGKENCMALRSKIPWCALQNVFLLQSNVCKDLCAMLIGDSTHYMDWIVDCSDSTCNTYYVDCILF